MGKFGKVYNDSYYESVTDKQKLYPKNENKTTTPMQARFDLHNQSQQIKHFQWLYEENKDIIELDDYLLKNLYTV